MSQELWVKTPEIKYSLAQRSDILAGIHKWLTTEITLLDNPEWPAYETSVAQNSLKTLLDKLNKHAEKSYDFPWEEKPKFPTLEEIKQKHLNTHLDDPCDYERDEFKECYFCGTNTCQKGYESNGDRHRLSDCRPDLVKHEIGETCTWSFRRKPEFKRMNDETEDYPENQTCYAYQDNSTSPSTWTDSHSHFYPDGPC